MKALTVRQPWAWAIAAGHKDVENRTQAWTHRGDLAIHAGYAVSSRGQDVVRLLLGETPPRSLPIGAVVAVVRLIAVHHADVDSDGIAVCCASPWAETEYLHADGTTRRNLIHLLLHDVRRLDVPVPAKGRLGLWDLPDDVERAVQEQLPLEEQEGCDCTEWCSMGPTCPGGYFAGLAGRGCDNHRAGLV